ncbi:MAG: type IV secretion system DNA-binding domain-containing protein [Waterburya sp.]
MKRTGHLAVSSLGATLLLFFACHQLIMPLGFQQSLFFRIAGTASLCFALLLYRQNQKQQERVTKGTRMVTPQAFQRLIKGDGVFLPSVVKTPWYSRMLNGSTTFVPLHIRKADESVHMLIAGDSGTGKSALQHTLLLQLAKRPTDRVAVYDPAMEFWNHHGRADRGDMLLHPLEDECPYWDIVSEIRNPLDAAALAKSFIPDAREGQVDFWDDAPRQILAELFMELKRQGKGTETLVRWLADPELIFDIVEGTELEVMIDKNAHGQRAGVLASLTRISKSIKLLPANDGRPTFSFTEWSKNSHASLYLGTRGVGEREGLRPILSAWLDTMFSRLMEQKGGTPTWCFVDELPTLQRLPSLKTALHEGRKFNLRLVLGFQGRSQLEQLYGRDAESLMSAPSTRIFLRSNEYAAADWAAKNIGMPEREREVESFTSPLSFSGSGRESVSVRTDKRTDYLVYPNEIQNLPKLSGYLRYDQYAVPMTFDYPNLKK